MAPLLVQAIEPGDVVMVKSSKAIGFSKLVDTLVKHFQAAGQRLKIVASGLWGNGIHMLTLLVDFSDDFSVFNVFRYITFRTGGALITSALIVFMFGPTIINSLRIRQGRGQPIRADGPQTHFKKAGTPTMGGLMIISGIVGSSLLWANITSIYVWTVLLVTLAFGAIGLYDDYLKVTKQSHMGFSGRARLGIEFIVACIAAWFIMREGQEPFSSSLTFPFFKELLINLGWFFIPFGAFVIVSARQRREPDRWARWAGDRAGDDRGGILRGYRLPVG